MNIAILGTGAIGSALAFRLSKAGHQVTCIARNKRLQELQRDQAIVLRSGERAAVQVAGELDVTVPYDVILVTLLAPQLAVVLPAVKASAAKEVMFMFNTFEDISPLRDAVGATRFQFGFPGGILSHLVDGKISFNVNVGTTVSSAQWAEVLTHAGIKTVTESDMQSWLRSHAAFVAPLMAVSVRSRPVRWSEAKQYTRAIQAAFAMVKSLGHRPIPSVVAMIAAMPGVVLTFTFWLFSRTKMSRDLGVLGPQEARMLIDQMAALVPAHAGPLLAIKPSVG